MPAPYTVTISATADTMRAAVARLSAALVKMVDITEAEWLEALAAKESRGKSAG